MTHVEQLNAAMSALINGNLAFRASIARNPENLTIADYIQMFGTVRIDTGRMSGKSTWIASHANEDNALVIAPKTLINAPLFATVAMKCTLEDVWAGRYVDLIYDRIYVDCASYLLPKRDDERWLIKALTSHNQQMVVLVG